MNPILTKRESTDGYKNGRFGNHLRQWDNPDEALKSDAPLFMIRWRGKGSGGPAVTVKRSSLWDEWLHQYRVSDYALHDLYISERAPDNKLTFQGEICELPHVGGYALHWSTAQLPQRTALMPTWTRAMGGHKLGPGALLLCKQFMDVDSYADLRTLLDLYPLHTVEFSCFSVRLGNLRRNTIFWEVRNC